MGIQIEENLKFMDRFVYARTVEYRYIASIKRFAEQYKHIRRRREGEARSLHILRSIVFQVLLILLKTNSHLK